jgi:pSer/pThr/pTyr-binding forkhead associated (FHA) protein/uncharacterized protein YhhL (DUF1145 family)
MSELIEEQFSSTYENTSKGSFFVISMNLDEKIQELQIEQIANNSFPGILKLNAQYNNNKAYIHYDITSKVGLDQYLNKRRLNKKEFISIIQGIAKTLIKSQNFLLYDKNFILDKKYIYIDSSSREIFMTYLPITIEIDIVKEYKNFVLDLIMRSANIEESGSDNYIQKLLNKLKADHFSIDSIDKLLSEMKLLAEPASEDKPKPADACSDANTPQKANKKEPVSLTKIKMKYKTSTLIIVACVQIFFLSFILIGIVSGFFNKFSDPISVYSGIGIIVMGVEFLLFRGFFGKKQQTAVEVISIETKKKRKAYNNLSRTPSIDFSKMETNKTPEKFEIQDLYLQPNDNYNDTVFLGNGINKGAFLKGIQGEKIEEVRIFKNSFIIGRSKPQVDFALQSKFVGKVHSEIINREDNYFIKDINSHNGTFVNNLRIDSNKEYEIRDGDKLVFADSEYAFFNEKIDVSNHFVSLN